MNPLARRIAEVADQVAACVCDSVATIGAGPVCFCGLVASPTPSWDYCGQCDGGACGMAYVTVIESFAYESFPEELAYSKCDRPLGLTLAVGTLRCAPLPGEDGTLPSEAEQSEAALAVLADMSALYEAVTCCGLRDVAVMGWEALPENGGCVGGRWLFRVGLDA